MSALSFTRKLSKQNSMRHKILMTSNKRFPPKLSESIFGTKMWIFFPRKALTPQLEQFPLDMDYAPQMAS